MNNEWKYVKRLNDDNAVKSFLDKYNVNLPEKLRDIIEKNNGGRPTNKRILTETNKEYVFKNLLSYNDNDLDNVYSFYPSMFENKNIYPLAMDSSGNFICYEFSSEKIILLNHESGQIEIIVESVL